MMGIHHVILRLFVDVTDIYETYVLLLQVHATDGTNCLFTVISRDINTLRPIGLCQNGV